MATLVRCSTIENDYDPQMQIVRAAEWLAQADGETCGGRRVLCLSEAEGCLQLVHRSLFTPVLLELIKV